MRELVPIVALIRFKREMLALEQFSVRHATWLRSRQTAVAIRWCHNIRSGWHDVLSGTSRSSARKMIEYDALWLAIALSHRHILLAVANGSRDSAVFASSAFQMILFVANHDLMNQSPKNKSLISMRYLIADTQADMMACDADA